MTSSGRTMQGGWRRRRNWLKIPIRLSKRGRRCALLVVCGIAVAALGVVGWRHGPAWLDRARGLRHARQGDFARAEPLLLRAIERDEEDYAVAHALAEGYLAEGKPEQAMPYADRCCALRPAEAAPFKLRMNVRRAGSDVNGWLAGGWIADAQLVLALDPDDEPLRKEVIAARRAVGNFLKAEQICRQGLDRHPDDPELLVLLARLRQDQGDVAGAQRVLRQVLRLRPWPEAQVLSGTLYAQAGRFPEAIPVLREAVKSRPDDRLALYYLTQALMQTGQADEARRWQAELQKVQGGKPWFQEVGKAAGIGFRHFDSTTDMHYIQETMGSGVAWIDYDNDGLLDLFLVQDAAVRPGRGAPWPTNKLYRNNGDGTFTDVTERVGLARPGYGMGVAVGDYDNDGYDDLAVTYCGWEAPLPVTAAGTVGLLAPALAVRPLLAASALAHRQPGVVLYHNEPDGKGGRRFVDVTARSGVADPHWATSCAWGDLDGDGFLDLYVCNYVQLDFEHYPDCTISNGRARAACHPDKFPRVTHRLFHNNRNGTFTDASDASGIAAVPPAPGLAVALVDLDGDGLLDIYVANDAKPAYLFHNQGGGKFVEKAGPSGCATQLDGKPPAGMGVEVLDLDGSGRPSLVVTNFMDQPHLVFRNRGGLGFTHWEEQSGINHNRNRRLAFGVAALDADLDGLLDLVIANGHISQNTGELFGWPYAQQAQLLKGKGSGRFEDVSAEGGEYFRERHVARGVAWADYDNDGRPDLAISHNGAPPALLHNGTLTDSAWVCLELVGDGRHSNRNAVGARVDVYAGGKRQVRWVLGGGSYLSACDRRVLLGLGAARQVDRVVVRWPSGAVQEFDDLPARAWFRLYEGRGRPELVTPPGKAQAHEAVDAWLGP